MQTIESRKLNSNFKFLKEKGEIAFLQKLNEISYDKFYHAKVDLYKKSIIFYFE
ncbi:hypothetical protein LEP1GSC016_3986 [Leptospira borgpetersenii serovar Hardjo-bovis str. Sponselee]|uniref:Uncharacterized protein n=4 Tax=Leptospira borgpetersenii TaxID=174 RepID=M6BX13_LEPBO|nr:hypothetical protein LEP1GSC101_3273 [Leptospira borgpetersenii str. UI 09149]EKR01833.1 hypothetical protein LEP1GSC121_4084 [Leptospira borgpetersenii serovar Castellonis str. 200801910]EMJ83046.1 hypothetical protein LEP1GSC016_3986 [Leptospira borgpetersenii serovar Hardjo-bovis str. Sponselee]EMK13305.1 hypothetical protein LEP1GSC066_3914 [Leptospira sp. serovar Kenya str. Sh9]EMN18517.1 hypothetical protein LEP1GSC056_2297 [Leptospira borgpetersenii str. Brem 328]EMN59524.1 hypotheti